MDCRRLHVTSVAAVLVLCTLSLINNAKWAYKTSVEPYKRSRAIVLGNNGSVIKEIKDLESVPQNVSFDEIEQTFANKNNNSGENSDVYITMDTDVMISKDFQETINDKILNKNKASGNKVDIEKEQKDELIENRDKVTMISLRHQNKPVKTENHSVLGIINNNRPKHFSSPPTQPKASLLRLTLENPNKGLLKMSLESPKLSYNFNMPSNNQVSELSKKLPVIEELKSTANNQMSEISDKLSVIEERKTPANNQVREIPDKLPVMDERKTQANMMPYSKSQRDVLIDYENKIEKVINGTNVLNDNRTFVDKDYQKYFDKRGWCMKSDGNESEQSNSNKIKIGILIPSSTRNILNLSLSDLPLVEICIPSLYSTLENTFLYRIYIGIDEGDRLMNFQDKIKSLFDCATTVIVHGRNFVKSVNAIAERAYSDGMDYLVRVNDDTKFVSENWASLAIAKLKEYVPQNIGVVGPTCNEGNIHILTHDMVHRTHLDIFSFYYPPYLENWWADDWITKVYEPFRSTKLKSWLVKHFVVEMRYSVDPEREAWVKTLLEYDKSRLQKYLGYSCPKVEVNNAVHKWSYEPWTLIVCNILFILVCASF